MARFLIVSVLFDSVLRLALYMFYLITCIKVVVLISLKNMFYHSYFRGFAMLWDVINLLINQFTPGILCSA
jgi:hypothetical protein